MVVISAGFYKTHMTTAAAEASTRGLLSLAITAAYPTRRVKSAARRLGSNGRGPLGRFVERDEAIPEHQLRALFLPEVMDEGARMLVRLPHLDRRTAGLSPACWRLYARLAARQLPRGSTAGVFHFRAGFGRSSLDRARQSGMYTLCDHALVHPLVLDELVEHRGRLAPSGFRRPPIDCLHPASQAVLADIDRADAVVVNSHFAKDSFLRAGYPEKNIHVVYLGVDDNFFRAIPANRPDTASDRLRLLFAGHLERRKGAEVLVQGLAGSSDVDWELSIAGPIAPDIRAANRTFFEDPRVKLLGPLRRPALVRAMEAADAFVFPSLAEGSARVVFEALACGCYVITTPNSGTIVEDGVHGALIPPGDATSLASALVEADDNRARLIEIGRRNAALVAERFRQVNYGDSLAALYRRLESNRAPRDA